MKKCPEGNICFSNTMFLCLFILLLLIFFYMYRMIQKKQEIKIIKEDEKIVEETRKLVEEEIKQEQIKQEEIKQEPIIIMKQQKQSILIEEEYKQIGILTGEDKILPLYGKKCFLNSNKWLYYTGTDKFHMLKIPVEYKKRDCTHEFGCDELYDNDIIFVPAYNKQFKVSIYQLDRPTYIPYVI